MAIMFLEDVRSRICNVVRETQVACLHWKRNKTFCLWKCLNSLEYNQWASVWGQYNVCKSGVSCHILREFALLKHETVPHRYKGGYNTDCTIVIMADSAAPRLRRGLEISLQKWFVRSAHKWFSDQFLPTSRTVHLLVTSRQRYTTRSLITWFSCGTRDNWFVNAVWIDLNDFE